MINNLWLYISNFNIANFTTLCSLMTGLSSAFFFNHGKYDTAFLLIFASGLLDSLDGTLATKFNCRTKFGALLDDIVDTVLYVALYPVLIFLLFGDVLMFLAAASYTVSGVLRHTRGICYTEIKRQGFPTTSIAYFAPIVWWLFSGSPYLTQAYAGALVAFALLMQAGFDSSFYDELKKKF